MTSKKLTVGVQSATLGIVAVCIVFVFISTYDDAYQLQCASPKFGLIICLAKYFIYWVLPYWWFLILIVGMVVGALAATFHRS